MFKKILFVAVALSMIGIIGCSNENPTFPEIGSSSAYDESDLSKSTSFISDQSQQGPKSGAGFLLKGRDPFFFWALDLSEGQKERLQEIGEKYKAQMEDHHRSARDGDGASIREQMDVLRETMREEMLTVLTESQKTLLQQIESDLSSGRYPEAAIELQISLLTDKLNLTTDQQGRMRILLADFGAQFIAAHNPETDPENSHETMRQIDSDLDEQIKKLLSETQIQAFEEWKKETKPADEGRGRRQGQSGSGRGQRRPPNGNGRPDSEGGPPPHGSGGPGPSGSGPGGQSG